MRFSVSNALTQALQSVLLSDEAGKAIDLTFPLGLADASSALNARPIHRKFAEVERLEIVLRHHRIRTV